MSISESLRLNQSSEVESAPVERLAVFLGERGIDHLMPTVLPQTYDQERKLVGIAAADIMKIAKVAPETMIWISPQAQAAIETITPPSSFANGRLRADWEMRDITVDQKSIKLTATQLNIFTVLINRYDRVTNHDTIAEAVWGDSHNRTDNIRTQVTNIRRKLGDLSWLLYSRPREGYVFSDKTNEVHGI